MKLFQHLGGSVFGGLSISYINILLVVIHVTQTHVQDPAGKSCIIKNFTPVVICNL